VPARRNEVKEGEYTWYAYDAGGMPMAVYKQSFEKHTSTTATMHFDVEEQDVYGSGRLGVRHGDEEGKYSESWTNITMNGNIYASYTVASATAGYVKTHYTRELGKKQYEIANHLGNVLVTVSDKRLGYAANSTATVVDWYMADVVSFTDYYVFGAPQTGRAGGEYRYGFNGKENDKEVKGIEGSHQDYGMRMYDPRVGRFFSSDPLMFDYPFYTPYQFAGNKPITSIDLDGAEPLQQNTSGNASMNGWLTYLIPNNRYQTITVPDNAMVKLDPETHALLEACWISPNGGLNHLTYTGNGNYIYSYDATTEYGYAERQAYNKAAGDMLHTSMSPVTTAQDNSSMPLPMERISSSQILYSQQQSLNSRLAADRHKQAMINYYGNDRAGGWHFGGALYYYMVGAEDWSQSEDAATYIGEPLALAATWEIPFVEAFGLLKLGGKSVWRVGGRMFSSGGGKVGIEVAEQTLSKSGARFIVDGAGNALDTKMFEGLKEVHVVVDGARGGTKIPLCGEAGTFANLGNGHKIVYGADGRAAFDVSVDRIKSIQWNAAPNGEYFPMKGSSTKFQGPVPQSVLDALGF
jgi:RHS repeat-associated protein